jgi:hypothetical protein
MPVTVNHDQRLYVIPCGNGYTCYGFDNLETRIAQLCDALELVAPSSPVGTPERYADYQRIMDVAKTNYETTRKPFRFDLTPQFIGREGWRVEVDGYEAGSRRRFIIGKSKGWIPCHLEIAKRNSSGGIAAVGPYTGITFLERVR